MMRFDFFKKRKEEPVKVLELFGGIGACTQAFKRVGIPFEVVDYVEIDKYACKSYNAINGTDFKPQDICEWDKDIKVDFVMHGSPCQDFSVAGKGLGGDEGSGTRSSLMYETIRIVEKLKPKNGYEFPEPFPLQLRLKDMLDDEVDEKYYLSDKAIAGFNRHAERHAGRGNGFGWKPTDGNVIANTLLSNANSRPSDNFITVNQVGQIYGTEREPNPQAGRIYDADGISPTMDTCSGGNRMPKVVVREATKKGPSHKA